jgi:hypothetical protein
MTASRFSPEQHRRVVQNLIMATADADFMFVNEETSPVWLTPQIAAQAWEAGEKPARLSEDGRAQVYAGAFGYVTLVDVMVDRFVYQFGI